MTLTTIQGHLYNPLGEVVTTGILHVTLQQDMVSVDGTKVAPFTISVDLSTTAGYVDIDVYATVGASPAGLAYKVEFDPDPTDTTKPIRSKDGYWRNYWAVPNVGSVSLGAFVSALRGQPSANYMPLGGVLTAFGDEVTLGTGANTNKRIIANQSGGTDPEIRYNDALSQWEFSDDGVTFQAFLQGGGGAVGGDLSGTVGAATVIKIQGRDVLNAAPSVGQVLRWNSGTSKWEPSADGSQLTNLNATNLASGTVPLARLSNITNTEISATAGIAWSKISKAGSSLADLAVRNASDLTGTVPIGSITGIMNANIDAAAAIAITKLADGSVTNTEFQNINDLDQHVATTSTPQFARVGLGGAADSEAVAKYYGQTCSPIVDNGTSGAAKTVDWNSGNIQKLTLTADCTLTLSNPKDGARYVLYVIQDGIGGHGITWPVALRWPSGNAPALTNAPGSRDLIVLSYDATAAKYYGAFNLNY